MTTVQSDKTKYIFYSVTAGLIGKTREEVKAGDSEKKKQDCIHMTKTL